jgi:protein-S-isoprenylcysteine O-methyltransferase Ste14
MVKFVRWQTFSPILFFLLILTMLSHHVFEIIHQGELVKEHHIHKLPIFVALLQLVFVIVAAGERTSHPKALRQWVEKPIVKFVLLYMIAYGIAMNAFWALCITIAFAVTLQLLRTPEEREEHPNLL